MSSADIEAQLAGIIGDKAVERMKKAPKPRPPKMTKPKVSPAKVKPQQVLVSSMNQDLPSQDHHTEPTGPSQEEKKEPAPSLTEAVMLRESKAASLDKMTELKAIHLEIE